MQMAFSPTGHEEEPVCCTNTHTKGRLNYSQQTLYSSMGEVHGYLVGSQMLPKKGCCGQISIQSAAASISVPLWTGTVHTLNTFPFSVGSPAAPFAPYTYPEKYQENCTL